MADNIQAAREYMERDLKGLEHAEEILRTTIRSNLFKSPTDLKEYDKNRGVIVRELKRVRAYIRDVIGD